MVLFLFGLNKNIIILQQQKKRTLVFKPQTHNHGGKSNLIPDIAQKH